MTREINHHRKLPISYGLDPGNDEVELSSFSGQGAGHTVPEAYPDTLRGNADPHHSIRTERSLGGLQSIGSQRVRHD